MANIEHGGAGDGNRFEEPQPSMDEVLEQSSIQAAFAERPHPFGYIGYALEQDEIAGPPKSVEEAAQRAAKWRLCHLIYHLPAGTVSEEELEKAKAAAFPDQFPFTDLSC